MSTCLGPKEKKFQRKNTKPPSNNESLDLTKLPQYISYKAALVKEKSTLKLTFLSLLLVQSAFVIASRIEVSNLQGKLRMKEYILAPGVMDFTTASPQTVPDRYIANAAGDFLSMLGNVSASNIKDQYERLKVFMSDKLRIQFDQETADWVHQVKLENISQLVSIKKTSITSNEEGFYKVTSHIRAEFYSHNQHLGHEDQVIEMTLKLVPPESGKRWYLQITTLSWQSENAG